MLALLSPAKTLDLTPISNAILASKPALLKQTKTVVKELQKLSYAQLKSLLGVSDNLARLNYDRYKEFHKQADKQAAFTFMGPAFQCLDAKSMSPDDLEFAQSHLRILSGVYGILRPCDLVKPYRLDMGKKLKVGDGVGMYQFWGTKLAEQINKEMPSATPSTARKKAKKESKSSVAPVQFVLNCASTEYSKSVVRDALDVPVIDCIFKVSSVNNQSMPILQYSSITMISVQWPTPTAR